MKTFTNLIREVREPGLCRRCGACVTFCSAINYGALEMGEDGLPRFADPEKCIECGLCYLFCPVMGEMEEQARKKALWEPPLGNIIEANVARARDASVRELATDGGVVTAILLRLFDEGRIDGAVVSRQKGLFRREAWLATSRKEIIEAAGSRFDASRGMVLYSRRYSTFVPTIKALGDQVRMGLRNVAVVGAPEQIKTIRKMQVLGVVPTDSIHCLLGLFCSGSWEFGEKGRAELERLGGFAWEEVAAINVRERLHVLTCDGETRSLDLDALDFIRRHACGYCADYGAEYADISFGGLGSDEGWTTVVTRTPLGRAIFADAKKHVLQTCPRDQAPDKVSRALEALRGRSQWKREAAEVVAKDGSGQTTVAV